MQWTGLNELRELFLSFFESKGHMRLPSFSLIPKNDPSLLLINSGMAPLKPYFTGALRPPSERVATCQKCIRTPDIDNVGKTSRHGTFFEMLGNFSFGNYFKDEAIIWAWEFITEVLKIPSDKLFVSIYEDDDEAFKIWTNIVGVNSQRVIRLGKDDNFWEHGTGPCGPCSEIHFDRGAAAGCGKEGCSPGCDCDRYMEIWNLVFTQYEKDSEGNYNKLPKPNIDTGMGLERLACVMQGVNNLFEVDTIKKLINEIEIKADYRYGNNPDKDISVRVITDHIRSVSMMISDDVLPSNEGRGYVLRRLLRRAVRHGRLLGMSNTFLHELSDIVVNESGNAYPDLAEKASIIKKIIKNEEEKFEATLDQGMDILNKFIQETEIEGNKILSGEKVFKLHDTYGFPMELTKEIAAEKGILVDEVKFNEEMCKQKEMAREALKAKGGSAWSDETDGISSTGAATLFTGYDDLTCKAEILFMSIENNKAKIILDKTPFYGESGGQCGDVGKLCNDAVTVMITDTQKAGDGTIVHIGEIDVGQIKQGMEVIASVEPEIRNAVARNHTATHLLQKALKNILGGHVNQAGSYVTPDRLRFDFTHFEAMSADDIVKVENEVNDMILKSLDVKCDVMSIKDAREKGAMALFNEKYGEKVRVVSIGDYSMELCGGTHLKNTSQAGLFKVISESGIAAGVRRIEGITGKGVLKYINEMSRHLEEASGILKTLPSELAGKAESLNRELNYAKKEIEILKSKAVQNTIGDLLENAKDISGVKLVISQIADASGDILRTTADKIRESLNPCALILASVVEGKGTILVAATKDAVSRGIDSGKIVRELAAIANGRGGGRPDMAQAGGCDPDKIDTALKNAKDVVSKYLK